MPYRIKQPEFTSCLKNSSQVEGVSPNFFDRQIRTMCSNELYLSRRMGYIREDRDLRRGELEAFPC